MVMNDVNVLDLVWSCVSYTWQRNAMAVRMSAGLSPNPEPQDKSWPYLRHEEVAKHIGPEGVLQLLLCNVQDALLVVLDAGCCCACTQLHKQ